MPISQYGLFNDGIIVNGRPVQQIAPGRVIYVGNSTTPQLGGVVGNNYRRGTQTQPLATIAAAVAQCVAGRGDVIAVLPGHAETVSSSSALSLSVAGISVIGLGVGSSRPTITLDTATSSTINVTAANVTVDNLLIVANFANVAAAISLGAAKDCTLSNLEFRDTSSILNFVNPIVTSTTSNANDGLVVRSCRYTQSGSSDSAMISNAGTHDRVRIEDNVVFASTGDFPSLLLGASTKLLTNALIQGNIAYQTASTVTGACFIRLATAAGNTGVVKDNVAYTADSAGTVLCTASTSFAFFNNYALDTAGASGILNPAADTLA